MKKTILGLAALTSIGMMSCSKQDQTANTREISNVQLAVPQENVSGAAAEGNRAAASIMGEEEDGKSSGKKGKKYNYEKVVTKEIIKNDDCEYIVAGEITYLLDGKVVAVIDFGDGTCDDVATKTSDGETEEFSLSDYYDKKGKKDGDKKDKDCDDCDKDEADDKDGDDVVMDDDKDKDEDKKDDKKDDKYKDEDDKKKDDEWKDEDKKDKSKDKKDDKWYDDEKDDKKDDKDLEKKDKDEKDEDEKDEDGKDDEWKDEKKDAKKKKK